MKKTIFALLFLSVGCGRLSLFRSDQDLYYDLPESYNEFSEHDYVQQYEQISSTFLLDKSRYLKLNKSSEKFLKSLVNRVRDNNELLFSKNEPISFFVIDHRAPFYFSTPEGKIFLSKGLLKRYIKNEGSLAAIILYEAIRIEKNLYRKNFFIPIGTLSVERFLSFCRIDLFQKNKINKWVYYGLDRSGFDAYSFLDWIQLQNKNNLDFSLHLGSMKEVVREESELRRFILKRYQGENLKSETRSSKLFYNFIKNIRRL